MATIAFRPRTISRCSCARWSRCSRLDQCREPVAVARIEQGYAELLLDPLVGDPLVVGIETERHLRELGVLYGHRRRGRHTQEIAGEGDDIGGWRRIVVTEIVDRARPRLRHRGP